MNGAADITDKNESKQSGIVWINAKVSAIIDIWANEMTRSNDSWPGWNAYEEKGSLFYFRINGGLLFHVV